MILSNRSSGIHTGILMLVQGFLYLFLVIYAVFLPDSQRFDMEQFFIGFNNHPALMSIAWAAMAAASLLGIALVSDISGYIRGLPAGYTGKTEFLAISGFTVSAASFLTMTGKTPAIAAFYIEAGPELRGIIESTGLPQIDPLNIMVLGTAAIWYLSMNLAGIKNRTIPGHTATAGILLAFFHGAAVISMIFQLELLDITASAAGAVLAPAWYFGTGVSLLKHAQERSQHEKKI